MIALRILIFAHFIVRKFPCRETGLGNDSDSTSASLNLLPTEITQVGNNSAPAFI